MGMHICTFSFVFTPPWTVMHHKLYSVHKSPDEMFTLLDSWSRPYTPRENRKEYQRHLAQKARFHGPWAKVWAVTCTGFDLDGPGGFYGQRWSSNCDRGVGELMMVEAEKSERALYFTEYGGGGCHDRERHVNSSMPRPSSSSLLPSRTLYLSISQTQRPCRIHQPSQSVQHDAGSQSYSWARQQ